jgi:ABC-type amino acid transport substrate-binding protein
MKKFSIFLSALLVILTAMSFGCKKGDSAKTQTSAQATSQESFIKDGKIIWTADEQKYIDALVAKGEITITTRDRGTVFEPNKFGEGQHGGIEFVVAKGLADYLKIKVNYNLVKVFGDYFAKDGVVPDKTAQDMLVSGEMAPYTPDPLKTSILLVDGMSEKPWRNKLVTFVKTSPDKDVIISQKWKEVSSFKEMNGKKVAVVKASSYIDTLRTIQEKEGVTFVFVEVNDTTDLAKAVSEGTAEFAAIGGITSLMEMANFTNINICIPLSEDIAWSCWAIAKDNAVFASIMDKYLVYAKNQGIYDKAWKDQFGITFMQFVKLIKL